MARFVRLGIVAQVDAFAHAAAPNAATARFCHSASARNGTNGATIFVVVSRHSYSVQYASSLSASCLSSLQNRSRLRRTYQFDRASTKAVIAAQAPKLS